MLSMRPTTCLGQPSIARRAVKPACSYQLQCLGNSRSVPRTTMAQAASTEATVDQTLNPLVATLKMSKTMALTDLARNMRESGVDVSIFAAQQPLHISGCCMTCLEPCVNWDGLQTAIDQQGNSCSCVVP